MTHDAHPDVRHRDAEAYAEAERLARRLPATLLRDTLKLLVELVERSGGGTLRIDKSSGQRFHIRANGNEFGFHEYQL